MTNINSKVALTQVASINRFTNKGATYNASTNTLIANGYTSNAGNTYFNALNMKGEIIIKQDVGIGYRHRFLNGVSIYVLANNKPVLIATENYHCKYYDNANTTEIANRMLVEKVGAYLDKAIYTIGDNDIAKYLQHVKTKRLAA